MTKLSVATALFALVCAGPVTRASGFYQWTDEAGVTHFATTIEEVPAKYREQVKAPTEAKAKTQAAAKPAAASPAPSVADTEGELKKFEIPYKAQEGSARRVIIPVTLNDSVTAPMALDTGSPGMLISVTLAAKLRLFSQDKGTLIVEAGGIGGTTPAILTVVDSVAVEGARDAFIPTKITGDLSREFEGLIGLDFLSNYTLSIDSKRQVVVFQEHAAAPDTYGGHDEEWWRKNFKEFRAASDHWRAYSKAVEGRPGAQGKALAEFQLRESERLLRRLDLYASDNAVPQHWR